MGDFKADRCRIFIETFGVNEILKQAGWSHEPVAFSHFRTKEGIEADLVCETDDGRVAAVEVKASARDVFR